MPLDHRPPGYDSGLLQVLAWAGFGWLSVIAWGRLDVPPGSWDSAAYLTEMTLLQSLIQAGEFRAIFDKLLAYAPRESPPILLFGGLLFTTLELRSEFILVAILSFLVSLMIALSVWSLSRHEIGERRAVAATALAVTSPILTGVEKFVYAEGLVAALVAATVALWIGLRNRKRLAYLVLFALVVLVGATLKLTYPLGVIPTLAVFEMARRKKRDGYPIAALSGIGLVIFGIWFFATWPRWAIDIPDHFFGSSIYIGENLLDHVIARSATLLHLLISAVFVVLLCGVPSGFRRWNQVREKSCAFLAWGAVPAGAFILSREYGIRHFAMIVPPAAILAAAALPESHRRTAAITGAVVILHTAVTFGILPLHRVVSDLEQEFSYRDIASNALLVATPDFDDWGFPSLSLLPGNAPLLVISNHHVWNQNSVRWYLRGRNDDRLVYGLEYETYPESVIGDPRWRWAVVKSVNRSLSESDEAVLELATQALNRDPGWVRIDVQGAPDGSRIEIWKRH